MSTRWWSSLVAAGLVPVLLASCARQADNDALIDASGQAEAPPPPVVAADPDAVVDDALDDITTYWQVAYPALYGDSFRELKGYVPYGPDTEVPPCGPPGAGYEAVADNAFYCPDEDVIAWDASSLIPRLNETYGEFAVTIVMAHEYGHAVQLRAGAEDRPIDMELQADCFAGAWTAHVTDGRAEHFAERDVDLDQAVAGILGFRDEPGISADDPGAHGSGFDRVGAFQDGYEHQASTCKAYADPAADRPTAEIEFRPEERATGGNLHLEDLSDDPRDRGVLSLARDDLNEYYAWLFDQLGERWTPVASLVLADPRRDEVACDGQTLGRRDLERAARFCRDENAVVIDGVDLIHDLDDIGDFAVTSEMAQLWAQSAQAQLGTDDADRADLQADCLTGAWAASTFPAETGVVDVTPDSSMTISAGDLDEGIIGFLYYGRALGRTPRTAFDRTAALRTGVFAGYPGCRDYGPLD